MERILRGREKPSGENIEVGFSRISKTIKIVDLLNGPKILYTPKIGECVLIYPAKWSEWIKITGGQTIGIAQAPQPNVVQGNAYGLYDETIVDITSQDIPNNFKRNLEYIAETTDPIKAYIVTDFNSLALVTAVNEWQANHEYESYDVILGPDDHLWSADSNGGTSGGSIPNFAANEGSTVTDGEVVWQDEGPIPTAGTSHLVILVTS